MRLPIIVLAVAGFGFGASPAHGRHSGRLRGRPPERDLEDDSVAHVAVRQTPASSSGATASNATPTLDVALPTAPSSPPTSAPTPVPTPWDTSISADLSPHCLLFISNMLQSSDFLACLPFSLLLSSSNRYRSQVATATKTGNYTFINDLIAYVHSPQPSSQTCDQRFSTYLSDFKKNDNCGKDLAQRIPLALTSSRGLGNYAVMREAAGIVNPSTGVYCYLEAIASPKPDDLYLWMLATGAM